MTSETRADAQTGEDAETVRVADPRDETVTRADSADTPAGDSAADVAEGDASTADGSARGGRLSVPLVPALVVLLVLLLAATAFLWFTRPKPSSVSTTDYTQVLEAARSGIVDLTSFDYLTLDADVAQIKKIAVGDLQKESVGQINGKRQELTDQQAVVNTRVIGAGVTRANDSNGTVLLVIESTQKTKASTQPTVVRYRIQVELQKVNGRWLLSGVSGR